MNPIRMEPEPAPPSTLRTRPTLLFRLRDWQDEASWTEFYRLYHNYVYGCARRANLSHADAEEVAQDVFKRVAETVHEFESDPNRGSFRGWLLNLTRWRITDKFRAHKPHEKQFPGYKPSDASARTATIERLPDGSDPEKAWDQEWEHHLLETALGRLSRRVPAKQFQVFDLYHRQGWSVFRVAKELDINAATVYVIGHRLTKLLKKEVEVLQKQVH
jgi:RNA polymerase sigma-70 factor (ECF subfamily)